MKRVHFYVYIWVILRVLWEKNEFLSTKKRMLESKEKARAIEQQQQRQRAG
jgi:hypothetical protein